ncbi:uncharacterized protein A4U43_C02F12480 [Asparagus officinalis]|uniref:DYW domain-containing protein n=1 Tax=Asparagus officinalis TaxID=4686 RepID=A0A5P1FHR6_ASPOF|nr:uncharacterized protein A4U43_C02F12480 [Asparagus officinalis]
MIRRYSANPRKLLNKIPKQPLSSSPKQHSEQEDTLITSLLQKCPNMTTLRQIHAHFLKCPSPSSHYALSKILAFAALSPSGDIAYARRVFDQIPHPNIFTWNSLIRGCSLIQTPTKEPISIYKHLVNSCFPSPNTFTIAFVLKACSIVMAFFEGRQIHSHASCAHSGLVSEGRRLWSTMRELGIEPMMEHYGCIVDLLCRTGHFEEAYTFVNNMPIFPNSIIWRTLLVGCKNSRSHDKAEIIAKHLLELEPLNAENYVLLSNVYASGSQWEKVSGMRKKMKDNEVKVVPGLSSIEIDGYVHEFAVGDESHPEMKEIRKILRDISERVQRTGHQPWTLSVLHDVDQEEKENALCEHSERLAIAFGMLKTKAPVVIRVVKNLRACVDCHEVTKIISKLYGREIIVRDRVRFHRFVEGTCSCNDFW